MKTPDDKITNWMLAIHSSVVLRHWRRVKGLTQKELAEKAGMKQENIARMERARYVPSMSKLIKVAHALGKELEIRFR